LSYKVRALDLNDSGDSKEAFKKTGVTPEGLRIMSPKTELFSFKIRQLSPVAVNILKQEALARGAEVAASRESLIKKEGTVEAILFGSKPAIASIIKKIRIQPFGLKKLADELSQYIKTLERRKVLSIKGVEYEMGGFWIMGILNATPDSFYDGGRYFGLDAALARSEEMIAQGADIIDVGGMSTRPGSKPPRTSEEIKRAVPVIEHIKNNHDVLVSIDTYRSEVAGRALEAGADIVNDISGLAFDAKMPSVVAESGAAAVIMHIKGTPEDMQKNPTYEDVVEEVYDRLYLSTERAVGCGIDPLSIIIDPGIGFGKTAGHNLKLIRKLKELSFMGFPLLLGASRKSFIEKTLGFGDRIEASLAAAVYGYLNGADILRVHDVIETKKALGMVKAIRENDDV